MDECKSGKVSYPTAKAAKQTVQAILGRSKRHKPMAWGPGGALNAYLCPICRQYHVGHQLKTKARRPRPHFIDEEETA